MDDNPISHNDPTGHKMCDDSGRYCAGYLTSPSSITNVSSPQDLKQALWYQFNWTTSVTYKEVNYGEFQVPIDFTHDELAALYNTGNRILSFANNVTNGKGQNWMSKYLSDVNFTHGNFRGNNYEFNGTVHFVNHDWVNDYRGSDYIPTHELAHFFDDKTGTFFPSASIFGGGIADQFAESFGGNPIFGLRINNGTSGMPQWNAARSDPLGAYGNNATAEYFAEVFANTIYHPHHVPDEEESQWLKDMMVSEVIP